MLTFAMLLTHVLRFLTDVVWERVRTVSVTEGSCHSDKTGASVWIFSRNATYSCPEVSYRRSLSKSTDMMLLTHVLRFLTDVV